MTGLATRAEDAIEALQDRTAPARTRLVSLVFGDRLGLVLFLASLCGLLLVTRWGIFINDTYTVANAFVALTDGHLAVETPFYGTSLETPGMERVGDQWYGRNYGQIVASIPAYLALWVLSLVADLRIGLLAVWALLLLALSVQVGRLLDRERTAALAGAVGSVVLFLANAAVATPLSERLLHVLALQVTTLVAGAMVAVMTYRLVTLLRSRRLGVLAGTLVLAGTPLGFWSPIPKRHVFTTLLVVTALYALARSRATEGQRATLAHGGAYACVGLLAWIHAPEAIVLLVGLAVADVASLPTLTPRRLGAVAAAFSLSLVPFLVTNLLISGDPFLPPRLLRRVDVAGVTAWDPPVIYWPLSTGTAGVVGVSIPVVDDLVTAARLFGNFLWEGLLTARYHPEQLYHTFVRSGYIAQSAPDTEEAINLSVAESAPLVAATVLAPVAAAVRTRRPNAPLRWLRSPAGVSAVAGTAVSVLLVLLYADLLPTHAQVTVRYLLPIFALGVVAVLCVTPVGRALSAHPRAFLWALTGGVCIGGQAVLAIVVGLGMAVGEAFQFHALLGLALAGAVLGWTALATATDRLDRPGAIVVGLATASVVVFSLLAVTAYAGALGVYPVGGEQALPLSRLVADIVSAV